jgi:hypothetical protein
MLSLPPDHTVVRRSKCGVWTRLVEGDQGIRAYTEGSGNKEEDSSKSELHDDAEVWI